MNEIEEIESKEKELAAYHKQFMVGCQKCGKFGHAFSAENKNKKWIAKILTKNKEGISTVERWGIREKIAHSFFKAMIQQESH